MATIEYIYGMYAVLERELVLAAITFLISCTSATIIIKLAHQGFTLD